MPWTLKATTVAGLVTAALCAGPSVAGAATLNGAGTLTYTAAGGQENDVSFSQTGPATVRVVNFDADVITPSGTCTEDAANPGEYECTGITSLIADAGDLDDFLGATGLSDIPASLTGGSGGDELSGGDAADSLDGGDGGDGLFGGGGNDTLSGGSGDDFATGEGGDDTVDGGSGDDFLDGEDGNDVLRGGTGSDFLDPGAGTDDLSGGADFDFASIFAFADPAPTVSITLDDQPNDGPSGENDNFRSDIEDVDASSAGPAGPGNVTIVGSSGSNQLSVSEGRANITGGSGNDALFGGQSDDTLNSRDGFFDRVLCGGGNDTAVVDTLDQVSGDCETIQSQDVGNANEDRPPTVAFTAPAANAARVGTRRATTLTATASDDRGVAKVQFVDDERIVCEDTTAPYTCDYRPRGGDVGRNTLAAIAIDTSQQSATALRTIRVGRFAPRSVTLRVSPKRDTSNPRRFTASGRVNRPAGVTAAQGCRGAVVSVQVKAGKRTISNRRTKLKANCTYRQRVTFDDPGRLPASGALKFTARYQGNAIMTRKRSRAVTARTK